MKKQNLLLLILIIITILIFSILKYRICIFYHIFGIPCPGCGLTRSFGLISKLEFRESLKYNLLGIPIFSGILMYIILYIYLEFNEEKKKKLNDFIKNISFNKKIIVLLILIIIVLLNWIRNIFNPILY